MNRPNVALPFLASRAKDRLRHRLVTAGPSQARRKPGPGLVAAPQLARSAVRVPNGQNAGHDAVELATAPHLFVHEGARQQLERALRRVLGKRIELAITDNRRMMLTTRDMRGSVLVRVHHMFLDADPFTQHALGRYLRFGDRASSNIVGSYIEANEQRIRPLRRRNKAMHTAGQKHDLFAIFNRLNDMYFQGMVDAQVTWGRRTRPKNERLRESIKLGTYCAERKIIRIHPTLDRSWVPRYFVEYVVFHEMLHHMIPMPVRGGRRDLHSAEFRESEQRFRRYAEALEWEQKNLTRLLRS